MQLLPTRVSSLNTTGVGFVRTMTDVERHAELVYAESLFEKVRLWICGAGSSVSGHTHPEELPMCCFEVAGSIGSCVDTLSIEAIALSYSEFFLPKFSSYLSVLTLL